MRTYGEIGSVRYKARGWNIRHLAYEYKLIRSTHDSKTVYVQNMKELKDEISKLNRIDQ